MSAHREEIAGAVARIEPVDALEAAHRGAVLDWIGSGEELYRLVPPDQPPMHLVSYFVPARECVEELGIPAVAVPRFGMEPLFVTVTETQGSAVRRHTDVSLWHVVEVEREDQRLCPDAGEFDGVRWLSFDELLAEPIERFDPHMHRFARKLRAAGGGVASE